jgi:protein ImuA
MWVDMPGFTLGAGEVDALISGGLPLAALHEIHSAEALINEQGTRREDGHCAAGFALMLALRARSAADLEARPVLWVREEARIRRGGHIYAPGLVELGVDPGGVLFVDAPDPLASLRSAVEGARSDAMAAVIVEIAGNPRILDLTATRRLAVAAAASATPVLLVRVGARMVPSAAYSRWRIAPAPSQALAAQAPGHPVFAATLTRHRRGIPEFTRYLEWDRDRQCFALQNSPAVERAGAGTANPGAGAALAAVRKDFGRKDFGRKGSGGKVGFAGERRAA